MNPLLILREEIVCLIILVFLAFISRAYRMGKDGRLFSMMLICAVLHIIADGVTVWTVNHPDTVSPVLNQAAHYLFILTAILFAAGFFRYILNICCPRASARWNYILLLPGAVYLVMLLTGVLKIEYQEYDGTRSAAGFGAASGFLVCYLYFLAAFGLLLANRRKTGKHIKLILLTILPVLIIAQTIQIFVKEFLFTGGVLTIVTVAFFFTLENPAAVLERKAMTDALNGLGSRSGYEHDMAEYEKEFRDSRTVFTFVFIDISNLRSVNGLYGHQEGDSYISDIAVMLMTNMKAAARIYRMGGDEFLAVYRATDENTVVRDVERVHDACRKEWEKKEYTPELAIGYAVSGEKYSSLRDVLRVADYMMYRNKADLKQQAAVGRTRAHETDTRLNLSGLTDRVFDAMCLIGENYYPYIMNMETGVVRVAPAMAEFFRLGDEFITGFEDLWSEKIHPDDLDEYLRDLHAAIQGRKEYHYCRYRVRTPEGKYVEVTCRGGLYRGRDGEPDIFCGYIVNHGAPEIYDSGTGLRNYTALRDVTREVLRIGCEAVFMKLDFMNTNRIRMLYGSAALGTVMRMMADISKDAIRGRGEVFSRAGGYFMFYLPGYSREDVNDVYQQIRRKAADGISIGDTVIPVSITAGAVELPNEFLTDIESVRAATLLAAEDAWNAPRDTVVYYSGGTTDIQEKEMSLLKLIHRDCMKDRTGFCLRYQPIIQSATGAVTGAEALLRWQSPEYGEVQPGRFISFLENDPAYTALGYDIIRMAVRQARKFREKIPDFRISVNITAVQLYAEEFINRVTGILEAEEYPPGNLILELTERCKEMNFDFLKQRVDELKKTGIRVALDDMGTGFSTIDLLLHLPVDEIKLDLAFTRELETSSNNELFAQVLCRMAEANAMFICFEGVETEETRNYLKKYGNVLLQGYWFDRPMTAGDFERKYCV